MLAINGTKSKNVSWCEHSETEYFDHYNRNLQVNIIFVLLISDNFV